MILIFQHFVLAFLWILYGIIHSLLASIAVKSFLEKNAKGFYRYYRLFYSIFAFVTLVVLLIFQYSFQSIQLIQSNLIKYISVLLLVIPGALIMMASVYKYFRLLSGISSLYKSLPKVKLEMEGIHKYVRHPLYTGTLLFVCGLFFIFPFLNNLIAVLAITGYTVIGIKFEERKLLLQFGARYREYVLKVPMLIPAFKLNTK
ncbi:MAG: NnrU family protein [Ginsengibacter sp.]